MNVDLHRKTMSNEKAQSGNSVFCILQYVKEYVPRINVKGMDASRKINQHEYIVMKQV